MNTESIQDQLDKALAEVKRLKKLAKRKREPNKTTFGGQVQIARENLGWSYRQFAERTGISASYLCQLEKHINTSLNFDTMQKIAAALWLKLWEILRNAEEAK